MTVDSVIETIETNVSETIVLFEPAEDNAISGKEFPFKCRMCDLAFARQNELKNHKKTIHHWPFICFQAIQIKKI